MVTEFGFFLVKTDSNEIFAIKQIIRSVTKEPNLIPIARPFSIETKILLLMDFFDFFLKKFMPIF